MVVRTERSETVPTVCRSERGFVKLFAGCMFAAWCLPLLSVPATAHDHKGPSVLLRSKGDGQKGHNFYLAWTSRQGRGCVTSESIGPRIFPEPLAMDLPGKVHLILPKRQRPDSLSIKAWQAVDHTGMALGPEQELEYKLRPRVFRQTRYWVAKVKLDYIYEAYVELKSSWVDREGCRDEQVGGWTFHVRSSSVPVLNPVRKLVLRQTG